MQSPPRKRTGQHAGIASKAPARRARGFTLLELSVVLVIIGLLVAGGVAGFSALLEGRRVAKTASALYQAKQCLLKRMFYSNTYPSYTGDNTPATAADNLNCSGGVSDLAKDVDDCLCNHLDAWGQPLMYLEGIDNNDQPLTGQYILTNEAQGQNATYPSSANSTIIDKDNTTIPGIAFVLISYGRDRIADNLTYSGLFAGGVQVETIDPNAATPDFSTNNNNPAGTLDENVRDDQIVYVTGTELISTLTQ